MDAIKPESDITVKSSKSVAILRRIPLHLLLLALAFFMVLPFLWMLSSSLKSPAAIFAIPIQWIPDQIVPGNYAEVFRHIPYAQFYLNTTRVAAINLAGTMFVTSLAGYAFARLRFPLSGVFFAMILASMMIPYTVRVIPLFMLFQRIGWLNTHLTLIIPPIFSNAFGVFLLRQFFMTIPNDLEDSGRIDGCSSLRIYWTIMLPLCKSGLAAMGVFKFMEDWNAFLPPLIFITSRSKQLLSVGLALFQDDVSTEWHLMMAASAMAIIPMVIIFLLAQRYFVQGIAFTGLKT